MLTRIVVGIDGSQGGEDAMALARALAGTTTELVLVAAIPYELRISPRVTAGHEDVIESEALALLEATGGDDARVRTIVKHDVSPGRALHEEAERLQAEVIVIGETRHGPTGRLLLGDISRATLHGAPCAVAIAPRGYRDAPPQIQRIGVACDNSDETRAALAFAVAMAEASGAGLRLATVVGLPPAFAASYGAVYDWGAMQEDERRAARELLTSLAAHAPANTTSELLEGSVGAELEALSERVDVLVAGSRGWGTARSVVLGSTTDRLIHHAACPVVVVPRPTATDDHKPPEAATTA